MENLEQLNIIRDGFPLPMEPLSPDLFDRLMAAGWRILGHGFIRHNVVPHGNTFTQTIPLRVRLDKGLNFSKSQQKLVRRNTEQFRCEINSISFSEEKYQLFNLHKLRFGSAADGYHLHLFLNKFAATLPVTGLEFDIFDGERLVACSFVHSGLLSISATYCIYDPSYQKYGLGNFTMLLEMLYGAQTGRHFYYPGYVHATPSPMDYKKNFHNLESYDWQTNRWQPVNRNF